VAVVPKFAARRRQVVRPTVFRRSNLREALTLNNDERNSLVSFDGALFPVLIFVVSPEQLVWLSRNRR
jgi:hypothetical protein